MFIYTLGDILGVIGFVVGVGMLIAAVVLERQAEREDNKRKEAHND